MKAIHKVRASRIAWTQDGREAGGNSAIITPHAAFFPSALMALQCIVVLLVGVCCINAIDQGGT